MISAGLACSLVGVLPGAEDAVSLTPDATATVTPLPNAIATANGPAVTREAVQEGAEATEPTEALPWVTANTEWAPVTAVFNGVEMVLVPPGCFLMGSYEGTAVEQPVSSQCIETGFWIDKTEVTQAAYGSSAVPVAQNDVTYAQASQHCAERGARLPSEVEWEYAARGPDSPPYPWGDTFSEVFLIYNGNTRSGPAQVGTRPEGVSWVGALDMIGNLWEWTTTIFDPDLYPYPYDAEDGREAQTASETFRVIRGGSFNDDAFFQRAASRKGKHTTQEWYGYVGFRCVMAYAGMP